MLLVISAQLLFVTSPLFMQSLVTSIFFFFDWGDQIESPWSRDFIEDNKKSKLILLYNM